jgi:hypothetical protein
MYLHCICMSFVQVGKAVLWQHVFMVCVYPICTWMSTQYCDVMQIRLNHLHTYLGRFERSVAAF